MTIRKHTELKVFDKAFKASMEIFHASMRFPKAETYSLTDQARRSSRSVCANIAEAWRKRRYKAAFIAKLSDAESEAAETQVWITFAVECDYLDREKAERLNQEYEEILRMIVAMINRPEVWTV